MIEEQHAKFVEAEEKFEVHERKGTGTSRGTPQNNGKLRKSSVRQETHSSVCKKTGSLAIELTPWGQPSAAGRDGQAEVWHVETPASREEAPVPRVLVTLEINPNAGKTGF